MIRRQRRSANKRGIVHVFLWLAEAIMAAKR